MKGFSTTAVCDLLELKVTRFREWINFGFIEPSIQSAKGSGSKIRFSYGDLVAIKIFITLIDWGMSREEVKQIIRNVQKKLKKKSSRGVSGLKYLLISKFKTDEKNRVSIPITATGSKLIPEDQINVIFHDLDEEDELYGEIYCGEDDYWLDDFKKLRDWEGSFIINLKPIISYVDSKLREM